MIHYLPVKSHCEALHNSKASLPGKNGKQIFYIPQSTNNHFVVSTLPSPPMESCRKWAGTNVDYHLRTCGKRENRKMAAQIMQLSRPTNENETENIGDWGCINRKGSERLSWKPLQNQTKTLTKVVNVTLELEKSALRLLNKRIHMPCINTSKFVWLGNIFFNFKSTLFHFF